MSLRGLFLRSPAFNRDIMCACASPPKPQGKLQEASSRPWASEVISYDERGQDVETGQVREPLLRGPLSQTTSRDLSFTPAQSAGRLLTFKPSPDALCPPSCPTTHG